MSTRKYVGSYDPSKWHKTPSIASNMRRRHRRDRVASVARKMVQSMKEKNSIDSTVGAATEITNNGVVTNLTGGISQGDGSGERLRDLVNLNYVHLRQIHNGKATAASTTYYKVRSVLIQWKPDNAQESPDVATVFQSSSFLSPFTEEPDDRSKFTVLDDRTITYSSLTSGSGNALKPLIIFKSLKGKKIKFAAGAVTGRGHIYQILLGSNLTGTECATYQSHARVGYTD